MRLMQRYDSSRKEIENLLAVGKARNGNRLFLLRNAPGSFSDKPVQTFRELNLCPPFIGECGVGEGLVSSLAVRLSEMHSGGLQLI